jgi:hypothetical protein
VGARLKKHSELICICESDCRMEPHQSRRLLTYSRAICKARARKQPAEQMSIIFPNALALSLWPLLRASSEIKEVSATAARRKKQLGGEINSVNKLMLTCLALERSANICQPERRNARSIFCILGEAPPPPPPLARQAT